MKRALCTAAMLGATAATGCGAEPARSHLEDQSRRVAPLPACVLHLPARHPASAGTMRKLREEQIVKLMFPSFDEEKRALPQGAASCTGATLFDAPTLRDAQLVRRNPWPFVEQEGDVTYGSGGDRMKIVWLRTHVFADGSAAGPIAVIRSGERFAELFALGLLRSHPERTRLATVRMGGEYLVTAENDGCTVRKPGASCETTLSVLLPRRGELVPLAEIASERVTYSGRAERGAMGVLEYHLTSVPQFRDDAIRVLEQVRVMDEAGRELRKAEHERLFALDERGAAVASEPSLWDEMLQQEEPKAATRGPKR